MAEYAIVVKGVIENIVTGDRAGAQRIALNLYHGEATVVLFDDLPIEVKRNYRFWNERP